MNYLRVALVLAAVTPVSLWAQLNVGGSGDDQQQQQAPVEMPDFSGLNEYIYQPKTTLYFGMRMISGVKATFSGQGDITALETLPDASVPVGTSTGTYTYHDGTINPDTRTVTLNNGDGTSTTEPVASDGKTNSWSYEDQSQLTSDDLMQMHIYSAVIPETGDLDYKGGYSGGMELQTSRDMGRLGKRLSWKLFAGMSLNDILVAASSGVTANITTVTDTYDLFGQVPGPAPYTSPNTATNDVYDSTGTAVLNSTGGNVTQTVSTTTLIGNQPVNRTITNSSDNTSVINQWKVHGAYMLIRFGPEFVYDITDHLHLDVSVGPALIYAGSTYDITETFTTATGSPIVNTLQDITEKVVPAAYADATLQYTLTDRTGFYFGAVFQDGGSYHQAADLTPSANSSGAAAAYATKVDFGDQDGVRSGVTFKF